MINLNVKNEAEKDSLELLLTIIIGPILLTGAFLNPILALAITLLLAYFDYKIQIGFLKNTKWNMRIIGAVIFLTASVSIFLSVLAVGGVSVSS